MVNRATTAQLLETLALQHSASHRLNGAEVNHVGGNYDAKTIAGLIAVAAPYCIVADFVSLAMAAELPPDARLSRDRFASETGFAFLAKPVAVGKSNNRLRTELGEPPYSLIAFVWHADETIASDGLGSPSAWFGSLLVSRGSDGGDGGTLIILPSAWIFGQTLKQTDR